MQIAWLTLVVVAIVGLVVVACRVAAAHERQRSEELRRVSHRLDLRLRDRPPAELEELASRSETFRAGRSNQLSNVLSGQLDGWEVTVCDHRYVVGGGQHQHVIRETVVVLQLPSRLPVFRVGPENVFHKIGQLFGYQDVDLPEHPEFSAAYLLRGTDEAALDRLFRGEVADFFVAHPGLVAECEGSYLLVLRPGKRVEPARLEELLQLARELGRLLTRP